MSNVSEKKSFDEDRQCEDSSYPTVTDYYLCTGDEKIILLFCLAGIIVLSVIAQIWGMPDEFFIIDSL